MAEKFGTTKKGEQATLYTLQNKNGMQIKVTDFGAALVSVLVPDKEGKILDVVLGYDTVSGYEEGTIFLGAIVGRSANRIGGAKFTLNGETYQLDKTDNGNNLHSGLDYYNKRIWQVKEVDDGHVTFTLNSPDMDQGYPGELLMEVTYTLTDDNEIQIHYLGTPKKDTIINMTNHSYFNLNGHNSGTILSQEVWLDADAYTRADKESIPTGEIIPVEGTPMDFRTKKAVGRDIETDYEALNFGGGYDHNWVLNGKGYRKVAELSANESGISMEVYTDLPGIQIYSGNFIEEEAGKEQAVYNKRDAICFETQYFPDAINKPNFASPVVKAGDVYDTLTTYKFL